MDPVAKFGEPVRISPLIKFGRWSALLLGITYGSIRNNFLQRRADRLKSKREQRTIQRIAREKEERLQKDRISLEDFQKAINVKL
ncbi:hypothetical protein PGB90_000815 [Kerria lacca]